MKADKVIKTTTNGQIHTNINIKHFDRDILFRFRKVNFNPNIIKEIEFRLDDFPIMLGKLVDIPPTFSNTITFSFDREDEKTFLSVQIWQEGYDAIYLCFHKTDIETWLDSEEYIYKIEITN